MAVFAGLDHGAAWCADGIGDIALVKDHSFIGYAVDVFCGGDFCQVPSVCAYRLVGMVIAI